MVHEHPRDRHRGHEEEALPAVRALVRRGESHRRSSLKTVLTLKVKWGVKGAQEKLTDSNMTASRLYTGVVCAFCACDHAGPG